ncbi:MAG TPA: hypothetical protein VEC99_03260 [Clostridia bacterium]|nr:hypothetical protein [Clostridia bacterium]
MSELDPDLKRLLKWSRAASPSRPNEAPYGFCARVLASRRQIHVPTMLQELQHGAWAIASVSLVLIVCGGLVLASQRSAPAPAPELPSALSFLANNLTP